VVLVVGLVVLALWVEVVKMAEKKTNPIVSMLSHIAMGIGGGLTGQDYLGTFYKWKESQKEKEPSDFDKYMQALTAERGGEQGIVGGTGELSDSIQMQDLTPQNRDVATLAQEGARDFEDFRRTGRPQLKREFGTEGKAYAGYDPIATKEYETMLSSKGQVVSQELKESEKKQRDLRRVSLKLDQSADILARTYQTTSAMLSKAGIPFKPERGIGGRLFGVAQKVMSATGYNEFVKTYQGNLNEAAIALMRMAMPGRSERMVNLYKKTLPDLTGNPYEDISQIAESMTTAYGDALATLKNKSGKAKYSLSEARNLRDAFKEGSYDDIKKIFIKAGVITQEQANTLKGTSALSSGVIKSSGTTKSGNTYRILGE